jgi:hypothetical protein
MTETLLWRSEPVEGHRQIHIFWINRSGAPPFLPTKRLPHPFIYSGPWVTFLSEKLIRHFPERVTDRSWTGHGDGVVAALCSFVGADGSPRSSVKQKPRPYEGRGLLDCTIGLRQWRRARSTSSARRLDRRADALRTSSARRSSDRCSTRSTCRWARPQHPLR